MKDFIRSQGSQGPNPSFTIMAADIPAAFREWMRGNLGLDELDRIEIEEGVDLSDIDQTLSSYRDIYYEGLRDNDVVITGRTY